MDASEPQRRGRPARRPVTHAAYELRELLTYLHWALAKEANIATVHRQIVARQRTSADPRLAVYAKVQSFRKAWQDANELAIVPSWERVLQPWAFAYGGEDGLREAARLYNAIGTATLQQTRSSSLRQAGEDSPVVGNIGLMTGEERLSHLITILKDNDLPLCILGQNQSEALAALDRALVGDLESGAGKQVPSGLSYWGLGSTNAWVSACNDPILLSMRPGRGMQEFQRIWAKVLPGLSDAGYHYVSLGPGNGQKDRTVLESLARRRPDLVYVPVDMSVEMINLAIDATSDAAPGMFAVGFNLDFSKPASIDTLRTIVAQYVGDEPVLYSLLGNTLANFDDDKELLGTLVQLLRPQDRLALEVVVTEQLEGRERDAWLEYSNSTRFKEFVTATLRQNSDISIPDASTAVRFQGVIEPDHAIRVEMYHDAADDATLHLASAPVPFKTGDTIRLYLSRKYAVSGIKAMLASCAVDLIADAPSGTKNGFGNLLMLLGPVGTGGAGSGPPR